MIRRDPTPRSKPELTSACRNLYEILSRPFEQGFTSLGYSLEYTATPNHDAGVYLPGGVREKIEEVFGMKIDRSGDWRVLVRHDEASNGLRADTLSLPFLASPGNSHEIVLKRLHGIGYVPLHKTVNGAMGGWLSEDQALEAAVFGKAEIVVFPDDMVSTLLCEAGLTMEVVSAPESRYSIARSLDTIPTWKRKERIVVPIALDSQVIIIRETQLVTVGTAVDYGGSITAYIEDLNTGGVRNQLVISFPIDGAVVESPEMIVRTISPSKDAADIANYGPDAYTIKEIERLPLTTNIANQISKDLMESLGEIA